MLPPCDNFTIICFSNQCLDQFPFNGLSYFKNTLVYGLTLEQYEVAIVQFGCQVNFFKPPPQLQSLNDQWLPPDFKLKVGQEEFPWSYFNLDHGIDSAVLYQTLVEYLKTYALTEKLQVYLYGTQLHMVSSPQTPQVQFILRSALKNRMITWDKALTQKPYPKVGNHAYIALDCTPLPGHTRVVWQVLEKRDRHRPDVIVIQTPLFSNVFNVPMTLGRLVTLKQGEKIGDYIYRSFDTPIYESLPSHLELQSLSFEFTNSENHRLQLKLGQPSFVTVHFRKKKDALPRQIPAASPMFHTSFWVRSDQGTHANENNAATFRIELPNTLAMDPSYKWDMCLNSVSLPNKFNHFPQEYTFNIVTSNPQGQRVDIPLTLPRDSVYESAKQLLDLLNSTLEQWDTLNPQIPLFKFKLSQRRHAIVKAEGDIGIQGPLELWHIFGNKLGQTAPPPNWPPPGIALFPGEAFEFPNPINLQILRPNFLMLYCDKVKDQFTAGDATKLFKLLPLPSHDRTSDYVTLDFSHHSEANFTAINAVNLRSMDFQLRLPNSQLASFCHPKKPVFMHLTVRGNPM